MSAAPPPPALVRLHRHLLAQLSALAAEVDGTAEAGEADGEGLALRAPAVSAWSVGEHADHVVRIGHAVLDALDKALRAAPGEGPALKLPGRITLWTGWIPRGVGKAPSYTLPQLTTRAKLAEDLAGLAARLAAVAPRLAEVAAGRGRSRHPVFGGLDAGQWLRFIAIHHDHHGKIVRAIRRRAVRPGPAAARIPPPARNP